jgi:GTP-binding protein
MEEKMSIEIKNTSPTRSMVISIIGRPNVGKSSLFNRLMKKANKAMVHDMPGVTRDRHYGILSLDEIANENETEAIVVDTGGFYPDRAPEKRGGQLITNQQDQEQVMNTFFNIMTGHAKLAIDEADLVLLVVDIREGLIPYDQTIANYIRAQKRNFLLVVNKYDDEKLAGQEFDFYQLGINEDEMFLVSSSHGNGINPLRRRLHEEVLNFNKDIKKIDGAPGLQKGVTPRESVVSRLAIIGAPNAGKSTLLNQLLGAERALVSDIAGTTVDPIEGYFDLFFGEDAALLNEKDKNAFTNNVMMDQYEHFRQNNQDVYTKMVASYEFAEMGGRHYLGNMNQDLEEEMASEDEVEEAGDEIFLDDVSDEILVEDLDEEVSLTETEVDLGDYLTGGSEKEDELYNSVFEESDELVASGDAVGAVDPAGSHWRSMHIVDTAGIRKQKSIDGFVEAQSVFRSLRCITEADIVLHLIDASKGISHQDRRLIDIALEKGKSVIVVLNKIDLLKEQLKDQKARKEWLADLRAHVPWLDFCDVITISAKYKKQLNQLKESVKKTVLTRHSHISTGPLNRCLFGLIEKNPVTVLHAKGAKLKIKYGSMIKSGPPTFLLFTNKSKGIPEHYRRYLQNGIRQEFSLRNTPVHLIFRSGADLDKRMTKVESE